FTTICGFSATNYSRRSLLDTLSTTNTTIRNLSVVEKVIAPTLSFNNSLYAATLGYRFDGTDRGTSFAPASGSWQDIVVGGSTNVFALSNNRWFAAGSNSNGELGLGHTNSVTSFVLLTGDWKKIITGGTTTFALSTNNKWFVTGDNTYGQMGLSKDTFTKFNTFTPLTGDWTDIVAGTISTFALSGVKWFAAGSNYYGNLGIDKFSATYPGAVSTFTMLTGNWSKIRCSEYSTWALSANTNIWHSVGYGYTGMLGMDISPNLQICTFQAVTGNWSDIQIAGSIVYALSATSSAKKKWYYGGNDTWSSLPATKPPGYIRHLNPEPTDWDDISLGGDNYWQSLFLLSGATWYSRGLNGGMINWPQNSSTAAPLSGQIAKIFNKYGYAVFAFANSQLFTLSTYITDQYTQFVGLSTRYFIPGA
ncbi:MAG: hypothetical protein EBU90_26345, partial [Proteobacteria bacterium]|nr:hypothetical protein [Pseudomonadota bacterium]